MKNMLTDEQKLALPKKRANRREIDTFYGMAACLSFMLDAAGDKQREIHGNLEERARLVPGGLRDLRMLRTRMENLFTSMLHTFEPDKQRAIVKQMNYLRIKTVFGPEAHKDPEMFMLPIEDLAILIHAATQECKVHMCPAADCARCKLGKALDSASFVTRGDRAWWEVFEAAKRRDVGMEDGR